MRRRLNEFCHKISYARSPLGSPDLAEDIRQFFSEGYEREKQDEMSRTATLLSFLSERELEVLTLLIDGLSNREMGDRLE